MGDVLEVGGAVPGGSMLDDAPDADESLVEEKTPDVDEAPFAEASRLIFDFSDDADFFSRPETASMDAGLIPPQETVWDGSVLETGESSAAVKAVAVVGADTERDVPVIVSDAVSRCGAFFVRTVGIGGGIGPEGGVDEGNGGGEGDAFRAAWGSASGGGTAIS